MKKAIRLICALVAVMLIMTSFVVTTNAASVYKRQKKSIYLVMDDSGSMSWANTNDANYSLQTLIAMADKEDSVNIYFLNNRGSLSGKLKMKDKDNQMIEKVCKKYPGSNGGTPYAAVDNAKQDIKDAASAGDETEYWLVVLTDGSFNEGDPTIDLQNFAQEVLQNGTCPNVLFISIGQAGTINSNGIPNLYSFAGNDIVETMNEAAYKISGRAKATDVKYSAGNKTIAFSVPYPAKNIIVYTQNKNTNITNVKSKSELDYSENYTVTNPNTNAKSTVCFVKEKNGSSIQSGNFVISFDKALEPENTTVLYEPAIGLVAHYYNQDGQEIDPQNLNIGEKVKITYTVCDSETKQPIPESVFGGKLKYSSKINGTEYAGDEIELNIDKDELSIDISAELPDGHILTVNQYYKDFVPLRNINFSLSGGGAFKKDISQLDGKDEIFANVLINGNPPTKDQLKDFNIKIPGRNFIGSNLSVERDEANSRFVIHPKKGILSIFTPLKKTYKVQLVDKVTQKTYTADLTVEIPGERPWVPFIITILAAALLGFVIWYFYLVFSTKKYFPKGMLFLYYPNQIPVDGEYVIPKTMTFSEAFWKDIKFRWENKLFWEYLGCQLRPHQAMDLSLHKFGGGKFASVRLIAKDKSSILIKDESARRNADETGEFDFSFEIYTKDFDLDADPNDFIQKDSKGSALIMLQMHKVIAVSEEMGDYEYYTHYVKVTTEDVHRKEKLNRNK